MHGGRACIRSCVFSCLVCVVFVFWEFFGFGVLGFVPFFVLFYSNVWSLCIIRYFSDNSLFNRKYFLYDLTP